MDNPYIYRQLTAMKKNLFDEGYLEEVQFSEFEKMEDGVHQSFVEIVMYYFFKDLGDLISQIEQAMKKNPPDFRSLNEVSYQIKSSCNGAGAAKIRSANNKFMEYVEQKNIQGCRVAFSRLKVEIDESKQKISGYFQMLRAVTPFELADRPLPSPALVVKEIYEALRNGLFDFATGSIKGSTSGPDA